MLRLLKKLSKTGLLTPVGLFYLSSAFFTEGINLMALLRFSARRQSEKIAVKDEKEEISYKILYEQSRQLAAVLQSVYKLKPGQKVAVLSRTHASLLRAIFALARLGTNIYLLNPEMSAGQFTVLCERHHFDFLVYDAEVFPLINAAKWQDKSLLTYHCAQEESVETLSKQTAEINTKIKRASAGEIIVLTGGTTGEPKTAKRKSSVFNFLNPFFELLTKLNLDEYQSVYIATPAYHGFGIAAIIIGLILGEKMFLLPRFEAEKACLMIRENKIEAVTVVPVMLQRMLRHDSSGLSSLKCIISGGAALNPALIEETFEKLGDKLFNLYGTSEAGFSVLATPEDLRRAPETIGKKIIGVKLNILDENHNSVADGTIGRICIKSKWSVKTADAWIETSDLGYKNSEGYLFLRGRSDEMIVSGGENVYPIELENILIKHPDIEQVAVIGIPDNEFGQRLKAFVVPAPEIKPDETKIRYWLNSKVARFQMPKKIEFVENLPVTSIGKINKKALAKTENIENNLSK